MAWYYCLPWCAFTSLSTSCFLFLCAYHPNPTDDTTWSGGTLVGVPSPALGRRKKWGKSLPTLPTPYHLSSEPYPTPPGFLNKKISPESYLTSHTERKERKEKKESKEITTLIFFKLQLKTPPPPQWSQFLWSRKLYFVLDLFSNCLFNWTWSWVEGSKRKEPWVCPRNKRTSNHLALDCIMELSWWHPSHHAHIHTHIYPSIFVFRRTLKAICNH